MEYSDVWLGLKLAADTAAEGMQTRARVAMLMRLDLVKNFMSDSVSCLLCFDVLNLSVQCVEDLQELCQICVKLQIIKLPRPAKARVTYVPYLLMMPSNTHIRTETLLVEHC